MAMYDGLTRSAIDLADSSEFEHWRARHDPDTVLLFNNDSRNSLEVSTRALTLSAETEKKGDLITDDLARYSALFLEQQGVAKFGRVGLRRVAIFELRQDYEVFTKSFIDVFFNKVDTIKSIVADTFTDTIYITESIKDGYFVRLQMAPLKPDQFDAYFPVSEYTPGDLLKLDTNFVLDIDIYKVEEEDSMGYDDALEHAASIKSLMKSVYDGVLDLVKREV